MDKSRQERGSLSPGNSIKYFERRSETIFPHFKTFHSTQFHITAAEFESLAVQGFQGSPKGRVGVWYLDHCFPHISFHDVT
jgi:hypothetical protein